jgi:hypothetical protein
MKSVWILNQRVPGSSPDAPTTQSPQNRTFPSDTKWGVSARIFGISPYEFWSLQAFERLVVILGVLSPHPKIPFPAAEARAGLTRLHPQYSVVGAVSRLHPSAPAQALLRA